MKLLEEFKEFISRGNVMDMAIGIIIGSAFTAIVTSLTSDIINPLIKLVTGGKDAAVAGLTIPVSGGEAIDFGAFISAVINFLIVAVVVFAMMKAMNTFRDVTEKAAAKAAEALKIEQDAKEAEDPTPVCPHCLEEVKKGATRCPHCTGEIPAA